MLKIFFILNFIALFLFACSGNDKKDEVIKAPPTKKEIKQEMIESYKEAIDALKDGDGLYASKKFNEAESLFPQSIWAPKSSLMSSYALYSINFYSEAIFNLERYIKIYPNDTNIPYAHYLIAICYFEQMLDEKKDTRPLIKAKEKFQFILDNFPDTDYAIDGKYKLDLIIDQLAAKEMYIGRYYMKVEKWIAAINRFKTVVRDYNQTIYIEEALHRLVEIYYKIGLIEEARKNAVLLGYNYQSSEWYKNAYKVFNKSYKTKKIKKEKQDGLIKRKIKALIGNSG